MENETEKSVAIDTVVCVGGMSWGKAPSVGEAFWNWFKHERPRTEMTLHFRLTNAEAYVDGMGTLYANPKSVKLPDVKLPLVLIKKYGDVMDDFADLFYPVEDAVLEAGDE